MDLQLIWIIILSISTPIAGVVGFAIQLRDIKKSRLENEKLQLEIDELRTQAAETKKRIIPVSTEEVLKFANHNDIKYSRVGTHNRAPSAASPINQLKEKVYATLIILSSVIIIGYFIYDIYRIFIWISIKVQL